MWKHSFRGKTLVYAITACACQGFLLLGYDQGVMSGLIGADNRFGRDFNHPDDNLQGDIVALYDIGCVLGSIFCFLYGENLGRRKIIMMGGTTMVIGTIILSSSFSVAQLIVGRIVTGFGNGMNSSTLPMYQSECSPANIRGMLLTSEGTITIFGLCVAYWLDYGTSFTDSSIQWRFPLAFQSFFAILLVLQIIGLPESPRWLVQHDRLEEARSVVSALKDLPEDSHEVNAALADIKDAVDEESRGGPFKIKELFTGGTIQNGRRTVITIAVELMQQFTGSNMINYYAPVVYQTTMHTSRNLSLILGGCTSLTYLFGSILPLFMMDRFGRRTLLMVSSFGLSACFIIVSILLSLNTTKAAYGAVTFIFIFQIFLGIGWLPVPWFYPSEINTTRLRSKGASLASAWNWMAVFAIVKITPIAINNIGWRTFIIFAVLNAIFIPVVYCFFPETSGLELEDIDHIFARGGITGGVFSSRGHPIRPGQYARESHSEEKPGVEEQEDKV